MGGGKHHVPQSTALLTRTHTTLLGHPEGMRTPRRCPQRRSDKRSASLSLSLTFSLTLKGGRGECARRGREATLSNCGKPLKLNATKRQVKVCRGQVNSLGYGDNAVRCDNGQSAAKSPLAGTGEVGMQFTD